jgi:hypothetical protein
MRITGRQLAQLAIVLTIRLVLSLALTFAIVSLAMLAICAFTRSTFDAWHALAVTVCAWVALRMLEIVRMTMPLEYGKRSWPARVLNWVAMIGLILALQVLLAFIFG